MTPKVGALGEAKSGEKAQIIGHNMSISCARSLGVSRIFLDTPLRRKRRIVPHEAFSTFIGLTPPFWHRELHFTTFLNLPGLFQRQGTLASIEHIS